MKKKLPVNIILLGMLLIALPAAAQVKTTINGRISSFDESLPLEGVRVEVKGTNTVTGSQADGTFSLSIASGDKILLLSLPGYEKKEVPITKATDYDIVLRRVNSISPRLAIETEEPNSGTGKMNSNSREIIIPADR